MSSTSTPRSSFISAVFGLSDHISAAEIRRQQFMHLVRQMPMLSGVAIMLAPAVALLLIGRGSPLWVIMWVLALVVPSFINLVKSKRILKSLKAVDVSRRTLNQSLVLTVLMGLVWGSGQFLFGHEHGELDHVFMALVAVGVSTGVVAALAPLPLHCVGFGMAALPPGVFQVLSYGRAEDIAIGLLLAAFVPGLSYVAINNFRRFEEMLMVKQALRAAHLQLEDAIEHTGDAFAVFDHEGRLERANSLFHEFFPAGRDFSSVSELNTRHIEQLADGRWVQGVMKRTGSGHFVSVYADITALKDQEAELQKAKSEAESASRAKSQFLAMISHELRTPLNSIIGFAELIERSDVRTPSETVQEYGHYVLQGGRHLLALISELLDLSRIEAGRYELREEAIDLARIIDLCVLQVKPQADEGGVEIRSEIEDLPEIWAEARAMRQILFNLLSNAIKFTEEGGHVTVRARIKSGQLELVVRDTGIGIEPEDQALVFEPFLQVDAALGREKPGTGLGLPLVQRLTELHGGTVTLESELRRGTTVTVRLPQDRVMRASEISAE